MAHLISGGAKRGKLSDNENFIEFVRVAKNSQTQTRRRTLPKKPETPKAPPKMPKMAVQSEAAKPQAPSLAMNVPMLNSPLSFGDGPYVGSAAAAAAGGGNTSAVPLIRIEPQYPVKAARAGTEGWVQMKFDITPQGTVENVEVVKSQPRRIFNQAAKRALLKWKYRPKIIEGKPVAQPQQYVQLDFKLR
jgi:protein TonB